MNTLEKAGEILISAGTTTARIPANPISGTATAVLIALGIVTLGAVAIVKTCKNN